MDVKLSGRWVTPQGLVKWGLAFVIIGVTVAPGFLWPPWFRILNTILFTTLALVVLRAYVAAVTTFRSAPEPPGKPDEVPWPMVSVLVPAYNEAAVLPSSMASMLGIDYPSDRIEFVYVYEARSTDGTADVIRSFAQHDPRFRAVERDERKGGKAAAANFGIRHCRGEFIVSLDADQIVTPEMVQRAVRWMIADPEIVCVKGRAVGHNIDDSYLALQAKVERDIIEKGDMYMRHVVRGCTLFGGGQATFRRSVFDEVGLFDEEVLTEDSEYSVRIHISGRRLIMDPLVVTLEENPPDFAGWWAQRVRWARGWVHVAKRYFPRLFRRGGLGSMNRWRRFDLAYTLLFCTFPIVFALLIPVFFVGLLGYHTQVYWGPWSNTVWFAFGVSPVLLATAVLLQDRREGIRHRRREFPAFITLWLYMVFQTTTFWSAFLDEFVTRRPSVYVKTTKGVVQASRGGAPDVSAAPHAPPRAEAPAVVSTRGPSKGRRAIGHTRRSRPSGED